MMNLGLPHQHSSNESFTLSLNPQQLCDVRGCLERRIGKLRRLKQIECVEHLQELLDWIDSSKTGGIHRTGGYNETNGNRITGPSVSGSVLGNGRDRPNPNNWRDDKDWNNLAISS